MKIVNITPVASAEGLKEKIESEAQRRGLNARALVGDIYAYAVDNKKSFQRPLNNPRKKGGAHIGAVVSERIAKALDHWAKEKKTARGDLCRYILELSIEDNIFDKVVNTSSD